MPLDGIRQIIGQYQVFYLFAGLGCAVCWQEAIICLMLEGHREVDNQDI